MKRPLFPDGFLINAHHSHPSARQEEPPPSFLSPRLFSLLLSPLPWGQVRDPQGWEDWEKSVDREWLLLSLAWHTWWGALTCWRAALCISRFRSQACPLEAPGMYPSLSRFQSFLPSPLRTFCLPATVTVSQVVWVALLLELSLAWWAKEYFNFPVFLSRSSPALFQIGPT